MQRLNTAWLNQFLDVPTTDPDDARRRRLLNIILLTLFLSGIAIPIGIIAGTITGGFEGMAEVIRLLVVDIVLLLFTGMMYAINRYASGRLASVLFLLGFVVIGIFSDAPSHVANGRSSVVFTFSIIAASVLLHRQAGFIVAAVCSLIITVMALSIGIVWNPFIMIIFFIVAAISWLAARSLEQAVSEARAEAAKNRAILHSMADGVLVFDTRWRVVSTNPTLLTFAGLSREHLIGQDLETIMRKSGTTMTPDDWTTTVRQMAGSGEAARFDWNDKTLSATLSPVHDSAGQETGFVAVLRDVTPEVEIERARESLFAIAAHELRTPLNAIINFAQLLREELLPPDQRQNAAARIAANGERLLLIVNNLLTRAQMVAGQAQLKIEPFAPAELIGEVTDIMRGLAQEKGLALNAVIAEEVPVIIAGDRNRVHQILLNLINNGLKFTEAGAVDVSVSVPDATHWSLAVADTGCGIPAEARGRIFEPFELAQNPVTRTQAGAGLGLYIVRQMVELMGGQIELSSKVGQGSTFTITLPLASSQAETTKSIE